MEEWVGQQWHRWVVKHTATGHAESSVELADIRHTLTALLASFAGSKQLTIQTAWPIRFPHAAQRWQFLTGHVRHSLAWLSSDTLYLPAQVNYFADAQQNRDLYFWWVALAAHWSSADVSWYQKNANAMQSVLNHLPGLKQRWPALLAALLAQRPMLSLLNPIDAQHEQRVQKILTTPTFHALENTAEVLPIAQRFVLPVPLWLYPSPVADEPAAVINETDPMESTPNSEEKKTIQGKKSARRVTESDDKHGLLLFRLENLFTVADWLNVQRPEEDDDDSSNDAAHELDQISLSRQPSKTAAKVRFDLDLPAQAVDDLALSDGILLPEWHYKREQYLQDHCCLVPMLSREATEQGVPEHLHGIVRDVRRQFKQWRSEPIRRKRQLDGNDIDIQTWLDLSTEQSHDSVWPVYTDRPRIRASRSTLLLADVSQSTESYVNNRPIIEGIKDALVVFCEGLNVIHEPFSLYAFSSIRRRQVRFHLLKNPNEPWSDTTRGRVLALKPGYYTRIGAAIRQSTKILLDQAQQQKWLLILTDGKPNDVDHYEHRYGIEDTRKAILEAREKGIQVFAITLDPDADEYAPHLFGAEHFHLVTKNENIVDLLPRLFRQLSQN